MTAVLDSFATPESPEEDVWVEDKTLTFIWTAPDSPPVFYEYEINVMGSGGEEGWWTDGIPSSKTSIVYDFESDDEEGYDD